MPGRPGAARRSRRRALVDRADRVEQLGGRLDALEAAARRRRSAPAWRPPSSKRSTRRWCGPATRCGPSAATGCGPRARSRRSPGTEPSVAAIEALRLGAGRAVGASTGSRCAGRDSAGLHLLVRDHGLDLDEPAVAAPGRGAHHRSAVRSRLGARRSATQLRVRLQGGGRDRRAGRQHRGAARRDPRRRAAAPGARRRRPPRSTVLGHTRWASVGIISEANAHPLNQRGARRAAERPYVVAALNGDVDNYADLKALEQLQVPPEITTDAKVIPALVARRIDAGADADEAFRATVAELEGSVAHRRADRGGARPAAARRCAAAARRSTSAWPRTRSSSRASRTGWSRRPRPTCGWTARRRPTPTAPAATRGQVVVLDAGTRGTLAGHPPLRVRRHPAPGRRRRAAARRDHHPRHRPGRLPALPAEGDLGGAGVVPQDAAGQARRDARRAPRRSRSARDAPRRAAAPAARRRRSGGSSSSARAPRPSPARASRPLLRALAGDAAPRRGAAGHRALGLRLARRHVRHAGRRDQPERHHHRHQPHRRPRARPAARRSSRSSTGATATSSTSPTACSTRPTVATSR